MAQSYFITGTDTEIGKTVVSAMLIRYFIERGDKVIGMKPVASGAKPVTNQLQNDDAMQLINASNVSADYDLVNPYCFEPPIAPHIAAQQQGTEISVATIQQSYQQLANKSDRVIVEGVGGWQVPLNDSQTVADLAVTLSLPVILVVGMRLGCLNHACLTVESILAKGCNLTGWIANSIDPDMSCFDQNLATLQQKIDAPMLAVLPHFNHGIEALNSYISRNDLIL